MKVIRTDQEPAIAVTAAGASGVKMRVLLGVADGAPSFTMRLFEIAPSGHTMRHSHPYEHEIIVRAGSGTLSTPEREWPLSPGSVALVPPDQEHRFLAGAEGMEMFCIVPHRGHVIPAATE
jgi:quercetin dioxygenase-like cupin family protein